MIAAGGASRPPSFHISPAFVIGNVKQIKGNDAAGRLCAPGRQISGLIWPLSATPPWPPIGGSVSVDLRSRETYNDTRIGPSNGPLRLTYFIDPHRDKRGNAIPQKPAATTLRPSRLTRSPPPTPQRHNHVSADRRFRTTARLCRRPAHLFTSRRASAIPDGRPTREPPSAPLLQASQKASSTPGGFSETHSNVHAHAVAPCEPWFAHLAPSVTSTYSTTWPHHSAVNVHTRAAGQAAWWRTDALCGFKMPPPRRWGAECGPGFSHTGRPADAWHSTGLSFRPPARPAPPARTLCHPRTSVRPASEAARS